MELNEQQRLEEIKYLLRLQKRIGLRKIAEVCQRIHGWTDEEVEQAQRPTWYDKDYLG